MKTDAKQSTSPTAKSVRDVIISECGAEPSTLKTHLGTKEYRAGIRAGKDAAGSLAIASSIAKQLRRFLHENPAARYSIERTIEGVLIRAVA